MADASAEEVSFKSRILNENLACNLCMGYFRNAQTITECLHTYCKDCILKYFKEVAEACPTCDHVLSPYPTDLIRHDRTLQSIVDKVINDEYSRQQVGSIHYEGDRTAQKRAPTHGAAPASKRTKALVPSVLPPDEDEDEDEGEDGEDDEDEKDDEDDEDYKLGSDNTSRPTPARKAPAKPPIKIRAPAEMSFCLRWDEENDIPETKFYALGKPYLRTSSQITVLHLKKYIIQKYDLSEKDCEHLQFRCKGQLLKDSDRVAHIFETIWLDPNADLELLFCATRVL